MRVVRRAIVSGRVQGVFYRASTASKARELGVTGHARNLPDGSVEVMACGESESVRALLEWLWIGSTASMVTAVEVTAVEMTDIEAGALSPDRFSTT
jgi:acylphosphatase